MPLVPRVATPATAAQMAGAWGEYPADQQALLLALWDFETGGGARMWCWNAGNIVRTAQWSGDWYEADDTGNWRQFRAYPSLAAGAAALARLVDSDSRPQWREGLWSGDPETFVRALHGDNGGPAYFEAPLDRYLTGFLQRWQKYAPTSSLDGSTVAAASAPNWYLLGIPAVAALLWLRRR